MVKKRAVFPFSKAQNTITGGVGSLALPSRNCIAATPQNGKIRVSYRAPLGNNTTPMVFRIILASSSSDKFLI